MAENKTINIKINSNTKEATKDTKDYNKAIGSTKKQYDAVLKSGDSYEKQLSDINKIVKETPLNVRDMNKQIQAYQSIALSAGRETPVGKEALQKASELRDRYIDIQNETKRLADDQKNLQGAIQLVGTGVAAFGGVQSAMALTGVESEKLRETMVKVMAAQTLLNSINQIATALEKESSAMLLLKTARTKALTVAQTVYTAVTGKATAASKLFKIALASTGIGLLVVGVGLLIANFDKLLIPMKAVIQGLKNFGDAIGLTNFKQEEAKQASIDRSLAEQKASIQRLKDIDKEIEAIDKHTEAERRLTSVKLRRIQLDKAKAKSTQEVIDLEKEATDAKIALNQTEYDDFIDKQKKTLEKHEEEARLLQGVIDRNIKLGRKDHQNEIKLLKERRDHIKKLNNDILFNNFDFYKENQIAREEIEAEGAKNVDAIRKESRDKYRAYAQDRLSADRKIEDLKNSLLEDGIDKELEINRDKFRRLQEDTKKNTKLTAKERKELNDLYTEQQEQSELKIREKYDKIDSDREKKRLAEIEKQNNDFLKTIEDIAEQNYQNTLTDEERELTAVQDKYFALEEAAKGNAEALNEIEIARLNELNEIYLKYDDERDAAQKVRDDKAKADAKALEDYKISVVQGGLSAINDIAALFAKGNEKQQKRAFQVQKAVGIAQATINTAQAITKVFAETTDFTPTQSLRIANAVGIGIAGAAQIASIASQQFEGGGGVDSPTDIGGAGGGEAVAPSFNVVGDSGINQIAQLQQQPVQAFVVSGEVTTSQALDRNRVQNATL